MPRDISVSITPSNFTIKNNSKKAVFEGDKRTTSQILSNGDFVKFEERLNDDGTTTPGRLTYIGSPAGDTFVPKTGEADTAPEPAAAGENTEPGNQDESIPEHWQNPALKDDPYYGMNDAAPIIFADGKVIGHDFNDENGNLVQREITLGDITRETNYNPDGTINDEWVNGEKVPQEEIDAINKKIAFMNELDKLFPNDNSDEQNTVRERTPEQEQQYNELFKKHFGVTSDEMAAKLQTVKMPKETDETQNNEEDETVLNEGDYLRHKDDKIEKPNPFGSGSIFG